MPLKLYVNGKFCAQRITGVQRYAAGLLGALDGKLAAGAAARRDVVLLLPPGSTPPPLDRIVARVVAGSGQGLHPWEQWALPRAARDGLLLNLAGSAPAFARRQVATLHDAAVFDHPEAYTPAFRVWYRMLFRRLAWRAEALLTVSVFSQVRLAQALGLRTERLDVIPGGADHLDALPPDAGLLDHHRLAGTPFLLAVASANPTKNLDRLLHAFARLPADPAQRLVIAGGPAPRIFAAGAPGADPPGVLRLGPVGDAALKALYLHAQALVFPSLYEGFGLPPLEAMACGCPVIAARAASLPEVLGDAPLWVDPYDEPALAAAMARLLADAGLRGRLRAAGPAQAARYTWDAAAGRLLQVLDRVAGPR